MGLIEKLLRWTPFHKSYKKHLQKKAALEQEKLEKELHPRRLAFYRQFIRQNDLVFDVGANVGNRVSSFLECGARVIAVEPQPSCVSILKQKFGDSITIENVGVGEHPGELEMHIATDSTVSSFNRDYIESTRERFKYTQWVDTIKVPITTLDTLIAKHGRPVFCKVDVEGYELQVLKGLHQTLPNISLEYCVPEMHQQLIDCVDYLHSITPDGLFNYSIGESMQWALAGWMTYPEFISHIKSGEFTQSSFGDIYFKSR